jgi:hypothetical protein
MFPINMGIRYAYPFIFCSISRIIRMGFVLPGQRVKMKHTSSRIWAKNIYRKSIIVEKPATIVFVNIKRTNKGFPSFRHEMRAK